MPHAVTTEILVLHQRNPRLQHHALKLVSYIVVCHSVTM